MNSASSSSGPPSSLFQKEPLGICGMGFLQASGPPVIHLLASKLQRDTKHCPKSLAGIILYSFTTRLLIEGALLTLCHLSDGSTCS